ncbi:MAG: single-stranded-DNA-specific exonuclease RecJ [Gemmatimonadetes bacterium]|nr:single-stranded-DNA-specific exonuclease RecJ [Gemmatimonadota bacterium]
MRPLLQHDAAPDPERSAPRQRSRPLRGVRGDPHRPRGRAGVTSGGGAEPRLAVAAVPPLWILPESPDPAPVAALALALHLPPALCALLVHRGLGGLEDARRFLRPLLDHLHPPDTLADGPRAADRVLAAVRSGETILVHGDYDVDGVCGAALFTRYLSTLGGRVVGFVPHRLRDGYDFGAAGLAAAREAGARLILTADCGVLAHEWVGRARAEGIDVVVTDHHLPGAEMPPAHAVVDPSRPDCAYPNKWLCGTALAWKLCWLIAQRAGRPTEDLLAHLDLVALATVADLVPLDGENRVLVRFGLRALAATSKPGLKALLRVSGLEEGTLEAGRVGFALAPRINAVGRMGDAGRALRLLLTEDPDEADRLAGVLDDENRVRQAEDRRTLEHALELLADGFEPERDFGVVLAAEGWHPGVIGIAASRVVERIHRPVVMVALDGARGRGSARSIPGFHLHDALGACAGHLGRWGGHAQAAGMDIATASLPAFRAAFAAEARRRLEGSELRPRLRIDLELPEELVEPRLLELLQYVGPHGMGNPRPVFLLRSARASSGRVVGKGHLKLRLEKGPVCLDAIGFGLAERWPPASLEGRPLDAALQLVLDEWGGERRMRARILDLRPSDGVPLAGPGFSA